jgi:hypothetical protein
MWLSLSQRILVAVAIASPPAFLMGFGFPLGIRLAGRTDRRLVPWGWGVNGAFSVLAPIAALVFSLNLGLRATLLIGTLCYAFASLFVRSFATSEVGAIPAGSPAQTSQARDIAG